MQYAILTNKNVNGNLFKIPKYLKSHSRVFQRLLGKFDNTTLRSGTSVFIQIQIWQLSQVNTRCFFSAPSTNAWWLKIFHVSDIFSRYIMFFRPSCRTIRPKNLRHVTNPSFRSIPRCIRCIGLLTFYSWNFWSTRPYNS